MQMVAVNDISLLGEADGVAMNVLYSLESGPIAIIGE